MTCLCGSINLPKGTKYSEYGLGLKILHTQGEIVLKLVHDQDISLNYGHTFLTTTEKYLLNENLNITGFDLLCEGKTKLYNSIIISIYDYSTDKLLCHRTFNSNGTEDITNFYLPLECDSTVLNVENKKFKIQIDSICQNTNIKCCDKLPDLSLSPSIMTVHGPCCEIVDPPPTTSTTINPSLLGPPRYVN